MAAPLPLTNQYSIKEQLSAMGFDKSHVADALELFKTKYGDDYNVNIIVELIMQIKNKHSHMTQQISNHNRQTIGTQLYYKIHSFEPILAGKICGMMLQWDTNKLLKLLNDPSQLKQIINEAKSALDNVSYKSHMDLITAQNLRVGDKIDFRNHYGKYVHSTVIQKKNTQLLIHFDELSYLYDTWCDYSKELHRFAVSGSITARPAHRLQQLCVGDMIDIKPIISTFAYNWTYGKITKVDDNSGQIQVMYELNGIQFVHWTHRDNSNEISVFRTNYEYVDISMDLLNWKALANSDTITNQKNSYNNIKNVLLLHNNEIIVVSNTKIYKYIINLNKWIVWITHDFEITTCCLNEDKTILYILSDNRRIRITQVDLLTLQSNVYYLIFPCTPEAMLMVENTLHFFAYNKHTKTGMHFTWCGNTEMHAHIKQPKLQHILDNLSLTSLDINGHLINSSNTAFIYCKQRNILLLFGRFFDNKLFVHSLKQNQWFSTKYKNDYLLDDPLNTSFGFALTNDEKYVMIFPSFELHHSMAVFDSQIGKILLLDIANSQFINCTSINFVLQNVFNSMLSDKKFNYHHELYINECKLLYPIIMNKTTILIEAYLKRCWKRDTNFSNVRLLSDDVISIIKTCYGYDNDELYIYCVYNGYLWNTKVNQIIKHQLPKLKFCADPEILQKEQQKIMILKNQLLQKHNMLTAQIHNQHQQQRAIYQQQFAFMPSFPNNPSNPYRYQHS